MFSLMEVMISFILILLCLVPLIYPNLAMYQEQSKFTQKIKLDHAVTVLYGNLLEQLHRRAIPFDLLIQNTPTPLPIAPESFKNAGIDPATFPYDISVTAQKVHMKGHIKGRYIAALVEITYLFTKKNIKAEDKKKESPIRFSYKIPLVKLKPESERGSKEEAAPEKQSTAKKGVSPKPKEQVE